MVGLLIDDDLLPPPEGVEPTVEIEPYRVAGHAGCNRYTGQINQDGTFGPLATTMMACPPRIMEFEQLFLGLLSRVDTHSEKSPRLLLLEGDIELIELLARETSGN